MLVSSCKQKIYIIVWGHRHLWDNTQHFMPPDKEMSVQSIKMAVILAAGLGMRLRDVFTDKPKGLLAIDGVCLVERSINQLLAQGIREIIIVTGYLAEDYHELAKNYGAVRTIHNPYFANSGSMYSLYCARDLIQGSILLLESDLIYEDSALKTLLESKTESAILVSDITRSGDEVYVEARNGNLYHMSKDRGELNSFIGELVGISKISDSLFAQMCAASERYFEESLHWHYEDGCLNHVAKQTSIPICLAPDLLWSEIDNATDLQRVQDVIWPQIQQRGQL